MTSPASPYVLLSVKTQKTLHLALEALFTDTAGVAGPVLPSHLNILILYQIANEGSTQGIRGDHLKAACEPFWPGKKDGIYVVMKRLERQGWAYGEERFDDNGSGKLVRFRFYWITPAGLNLVNDILGIYHALEPLPKST